MVSEKMYVVKSDFIIYRRGGQVKAIATAPAPKPAPRKLEDRPLVINDKAVSR